VNSRGNKAARIEPALGVGIEHLHTDAITTGAGNGNEEQVGCVGLTGHQVREERAQRPGCRLAPTVSGKVSRRQT
jgi:hypothetical protein